MTLVRRIFGLALGFALFLVVVFALMRTPDTNRDDMIAKYGGANAMFADGAGGMRVHWRDEGCGDCPALILLHGSNASLHTWAPLIAELSGEYRIITLDLPGHGLTGRHPRDDYSAEGMFEALDAVAGAAGLDHFYLGGNSMGGWISWRYALAHPERVDGLIMLDAAGAPLREGETAPTPPIGFMLMRNPVFAPVIEQITPRDVIKKTLLGSISNKAIVNDAMIDRYWELNRFPGYRRATAIRARRDLVDPHADRLGEITQPTLVLWGREDALIPVSAAQTFDERIPNAEIVILDGVGHLPMEEASQATANAIRRFLEARQPEAVDMLKLEQPR